MTPQTRSLGPLVLWTLFVWGTRVNNIAADDDLSAGAKALRYGWSGVFVAGAVWFAVVLVRRRPLSGLDRGILAGLCVWTAGFWIVRSIQIVAADHDLAFTIVHLVLMVVSITLAALAAQLLDRSPRRRRAPSPVS